MCVNWYERNTGNLAIFLAAVAGYVDALGFIELGGFFVAFMTGNSTRAGVGVATGSADALIAAGLILAFLLGVVLSTLVGQVAGRRRPSAIVILVAALLALAALLGGQGMRPVAALVMAMAMGAENAVFERNGEVSIGLTYMTGTLVKLGQRLATALMGGDRWGWVPHLKLWLGLMVGGVAGAMVYPFAGLQGLWLAVLLLLLVGAVIPPRTAA